MTSMFLNPVSAGITSAAIFVLLNILGISSLFLILSIIPLLCLGYVSTFDKLLPATAIASGILLLFNPISSLFFISSIAVPALFLIARQKRGFTVMHAITDICTYALVVLTLVHLTSLEAGGIANWISSRFDFSTIDHLDPALLTQIQWLSNQGSYLLVGMMVWWGVIFVLIAVWLTEKLLKNTNDALPAVPTIRYFSAQATSIWLLPGLILSIAIGFLAPENIRFLGLLSFVIILLPYFFFGAMYTPLKQMLERSLGWSLVITMVLLVLAWPALLIVLVGVYKHAHAIISPPRPVD